MVQEPIESRMSIAGHPIHPTLIHFPVAALIGLVASDLAYLFTDDIFWARASFWLASVGAWGGWLASTAGLVDLLLVSSIRRKITAWSHAVLAVMMLSLASLNWLMRVEDPAHLLLPWGLYVSVLTTLLIFAASILGGQLVYEHGVGVDIES